MGATKCARRAYPRGGARCSARAGLDPLRHPARLGDSNSGSAPAEETSHHEAAVPEKVLGGSVPPADGVLSNLYGKDHEAPAPAAHKPSPPTPEHHGVAAHAFEPADLPDIPDLGAHDVADIGHGLTLGFIGQSYHDPVDPHDPGVSSLGSGLHGLI
jgi:hypothetical protein